MSQIKGVIEVLCKLLRSFGFSDYTAEDFRLAKYDKPEAVKKMWRLLYELIIFNYNEKMPDQQDEIFNKLTPDTLISCCKNELMRRGYHCEDFLRLVHDYNTTNTSRSVLITIGWFISNQNIIKKLINNSQTVFDSEFCKDIAIEKVDYEQMTKEKESLRQRFIKNEQNPVALLQLLKWLKGNISKKLNTLFSCENEKSKLISEAHKFTENCGPYAFSSLSSFEIYLLKNPDKLEKYEKYLEVNSEMLSHLINWLQNENTFWKWLESVVDEKLQENNNEKLNSENSKKIFESIVFNVRDTELDSLDKSKELFESTIDKLNRINECEKKQSDFEISEKYLTEIDEYDLYLDDSLKNIFNVKDLIKIDSKSEHNYFNLTHNRFDLNPKPNKQKDYQSLDDKLKKIEKVLYEKQASHKNRLKMASDDCELLTQKLKNTLMITK